MVSKVTVETTVTPLTEKQKSRILVLYDVNKHTVMTARLLRDRNKARSYISFIEDMVDILGYKIKRSDSGFTWTLVPLEKEDEL